MTQYRCRKRPREQPTRTVAAGKTNRASSTVTKYSKYGRTSHETPFAPTPRTTVCGKDCACQMDSCFCKFSLHHNDSLRMKKRSPLAEIAAALQHRLKWRLKHPSKWYQAQTDRRNNKFCWPHFCNFRCRQKTSELQ